MEKKKRAPRIARVIFSRAPGLTWSCSNLPAFRVGIRGSDRLCAIDQRAREFNLLYVSSNGGYFALAFSCLPRK